jgi:hyperosmotically inducible protein
MNAKKFLQWTVAGLMLATSLSFAATSTTMSDDAITTKVKAEYVKEKLFGDKPIAPMTIHVKTSHGIVHLSGTVESKDLEANAETIAKAVDGVKGVVSTVKIKAVTTSK